VTKLERTLFLVHTTVSMCWVTTKWCWSIYYCQYVPSHHKMMSEYILLSVCAKSPQNDVEVHTSVSMCQVTTKCCRSTYYCQYVPSHRKMMSKSWWYGLYKLWTELFSGD